jgi:hypothetical protein
VEAGAVVADTSAPNALKSASGKQSRIPVKVHCEKEKGDGYIFMRWTGIQDGSNGDGFKAGMIEKMSFAFFLKA